MSSKLVDEVRKHGQGITQYIRFSASGETLLHRHIYEMMEYASKNSGVMVTLTTNGALMNTNKIEKILDSGVHVIDISIDAFTPETYVKVRNKGDLNITRANVLKLIKMSKQLKNHTKVVVSYIEQPLNTHETKNFEIFWKDNGADYVVIRRLHSQAGLMTDIANGMRQESTAEIRRPCLYPWERLVLNPPGYLAFCPDDWVHGSSIIDYRDTTIYETWRGEFYQKLRKAHLANMFADYQFCGQCPDWKNTNWPDKGRSYADVIEEFIEEEKGQDDENNNAYN